MFKRAILALLVLVSISVLIIAAFAISGNNNSSNNIASNVGVPLSNISNNNPTTSESQYNDQNQNLVTQINRKIISPVVAKLIAKKYIEEPGATPGTPKLVKQDGKKVYIVPVIENKKNVGEIYIDAHSGKNLGGAGGAPLK